VRFLSTLAITDWETGASDSVPIEVISRPSLLYLQLFGGSLSGIVTSAIRIGLLVLVLLFASLEALALWMAIRLSRTMTTSVADLYRATLSIDRGDLTHRIAVTSNDQLAELSRSFNRMIGSLGRLLEEQKEKERLQNELSIAQEVQANLFPSAVVDLPTLELHGICRPARSVSGDYYDFLVSAENLRRGPSVCIALGDISGKGISAALLMATLHSAIRAYQFAEEEEGDSASFASPGTVMARLNRHLYRSTQPEKYATLFLAHYDASTRWLTYSTAGQLPPLLLGLDGSVRRLDCGGTVVGLMDHMSYEQGSVPIHLGDILVAYSDGVTEPENDFGDFGEDRLLEVVRRFQHEPLPVISREVMAALDDWIGAAEQPDDITLVLARQR
jgi:sigma-B regulation protein RsbU (phosphoserine phosphatase)